MAKVKLSQPWFGPSDPYHPDKLRVFSGRYYEKYSIIDVPEDMLDKLPKGTKRVDDEAPVKDRAVAPEPAVTTLRDFELERVQDQIISDTNEKADKAFRDNQKNKKKD